jgi:hypothetical protein
VSANLRPGLQRRLLVNAQGEVLGPAFLRTLVERYVNDLEATTFHGRQLPDVLAQARSRAARGRDHPDELMGSEVSSNPCPTAAPTPAASTPTASAPAARPTRAASAPTAPTRTAPAPAAHAPAARLRPCSPRPCCPHPCTPCCFCALTHPPLRAQAQRRATWAEDTELALLGDALGCEVRTYLPTYLPTTYQLSSTPSILV